MTCRNCGNDLADHLKFCPKCGTPVSAAPYVPPVAPAQPNWQLNAPIAPVKRKSRAGKILLIVGIVIVLLAGGIGVAIYFGVRSYLQSTKSSAPYALAESTLRSSVRVKEKIGEIKNIGVPLGTFKEEPDGTGFAAFVMSVKAEKESGQYVVAMDRYNSNWRIKTAQVKLASGEEIVLESPGLDMTTDQASDGNDNANTNTNSNTENSNDANQKPGVISGGVLNGKATSLPQPVYPPAARSARASGTVVVEVTVDERGRVVSASAVSGHPLLRASAVSAAREARFSTTKLSGKPVKVTGQITYNFVAEP